MLSGVAETTDGALIHGWSLTERIACCDRTLLSWYALSALILHSEQTSD